MSRAAAAVSSARSKSENVRVAVRCRPLNSAEKERGEVTVVAINRSLGSVAIHGSSAEEDAGVPSSSTTSSSSAVSRTFTFDLAYGPDSSQLSIFSETAQPIVESVMSGYNGTIFAYGQTGTGKTHTMEGVVESEEMRGLMPNTFHHIFSQISTAPPHVQFLVRCSFLEVYLDDVYDLLSTTTQGQPQGEERRATSKRAKTEASTSKTSSNAQ